MNIFNIRLFVFIQSHCVDFRGDVFLNKAIWQVNILIMIRLKENSDGCNKVLHS